VTDAFGLEQQSIEEIQICPFPVPIGFSGVEEESDIRIDGVQFVDEFDKRFPLVFLADQIKANHEFRINPLQLRHRFQVVIHRLRIDGSHRCVYQLSPDEIRMVLYEPVAYSSVTSI